MSFESNAEFKVEHQINGVFDEISANAKTHRKLLMGMAAFDLVDLISEERLASNEELTRWLLEGKDDRKSPPGGPSAIGTRILGGHVSASFAPEEEVLLLDVPAEFSDDPDRLDTAREKLAEAISLLPSTYRLTRWQARRVEAKARALKYPKYT